jgi:predicted acyltransferase
MPDQNSASVDTGVFFVQTVPVQVDLLTPATGVRAAHERGRFEEMVPVRLAQPAARLASLDVFRGLTMAGMVIVNNPGTWDAMHWPLEHSDWNGWTPTDLIFPFFLFIVGISLTLSRQTLEATWWRIGRRGAVLIGCGLFMAGFPFFDPHHWRIPGVLQRIGVCYLAAAVVYRWSAPNGDGTTRAVSRSRVLVLSAIAAVILVAYWWVLTRFGDLSPEGNVGASIDRALMGGHLWKPAWDPEGLLSTLPAIATTMTGVLAGLWLRASMRRHTSTGASSTGSAAYAPSASPRQTRTQSGSPRLERRCADSLARTCAGLLVAGAVAFGVGQAWGSSFPINKQLWTSSYVVLTSGAAAIMLGLCIYVIDVRGFHAWARPFEIFGKNALTLFVVSGLIGKLLIVIKVPRGAGGSVSLQEIVYQRGFQWLASPKNASLIYSFAFLALMYAICATMSRRQVFLRA